MKKTISPGAADAKQRNRERYGERIKQYRVRAGLTAGQLASALQVSESAVRNWECGLTRPDPEYLYRMFTLLRVEPNEFFGLPAAVPQLSPLEGQLLRACRALDNAGQEDLLCVAEALGTAAHRRALRQAAARMVAVRSWGRMAAAGDGADWPDHPEAEETILYAGAETARADEVITVSGRSMEPRFRDGEQVLVQYCTELRVGDIGIFYVPGYGGVIKQRGADHLHSLNPDYDDIFPYEDGARLVGRVLCGVEPGMIPSPQERALYLEARGEAYAQS